MWETFFQSRPGDFPSKSKDTDFLDYLQNWEEKKSLPVDINNDEFLGNEFLEVYSLDWM
jgi:hypothetical protein